MPSQKTHLTELMLEGKESRMPYTLGRITGILRMSVPGDNSIQLIAGALADYYEADISEIDLPCNRRVKEDTISELRELERRSI